MKPGKSLKKPLAILGISAIITANLLFVRGEIHLPPAEIFAKPDKIVCRTVPKPSGSDWYEYEVYLPRGQNYFLDAEARVDGEPRESGRSGIYRGSWTPYRFRFRASTDDDSRFKEFLESQKIAFDNRTKLLMTDWEWENPHITGRSVISGHETIINHFPITLHTEHPSVQSTSGRTEETQLGAVGETLWIAHYEIQGDRPGSGSSMPAPSRGRDWQDEMAVQSGGHRVRFGIRFIIAPDLPPGQNQTGPGPR